jgi:hypothetical protein
VAKEIPSGYDVEIVNANFSYNRSANTRFTWKFSSKYLYTESSFENPNIVFQGEGGYPLFYGNKITFTWKFNIRTIKNDLSPFFDNFGDLDTILSTLNHRLATTDFEISYNNWTIVIKNNVLRLEFNNWQITFLNYNWRRLVTSPIPISSLDGLFE